MKSVFQTIVSLAIFSFFMLGLTGTTVAQSKEQSKTNVDQTVSFKVYGVCDDCKERIESSALDAKGVKKAEWDKQSDILVLVGSSKMDKQKVADTVAKAGYKSELAEADKKGYAKLPACCQYDGKIEKH